MTKIFGNPAIWQLVRFQANAKFRRMTRGFTCPRRVFWSILATVLAVLWLSNAALSILYRESAGVERFRKWVPVGLLVYALWHLVKVVCRRPEEGIEWTPAERELLCGGPFKRHELILYRMAGIANAGLVKAACFTALMLPDLTLFVTGFVGTFLALLFLDLIRLGVEISAHGMSDAIYGKLRTVTITTATAVILASLYIAFTTPVSWNPGPVDLSLGLIAHVFRSAASLAHTPVGEVLQSPFVVFSELITATSYSAATFMWLALALFMVVGLLAGLIRVDRYFYFARQLRERGSYPPTCSQKSDSVSRARERLPRIRWLGGVGPIVWRQLIGALRQRSSLLFALALPGILASLPILVYPDGKRALLNVCGALSFYSFLLLPSALKFDFRRDIQRMIVLKSLPIQPVFIVMGQILAPVLLAFLFQVVVLTVTLCVRPFPVWMLLAVASLLLPLNVLIFSLDNLAYLLYPYRLNQEGIEIFLRTTLTFTAKGVLFAVGVVVTLCWSFAANQISRLLFGSTENSAIIFVIGAGLMLCAASGLILGGLSRAFARFDPSQDTPA